MVVATRNVNVVLMLQGEVFHDVVGPLGAWEANGVAAIAELLDDCIRERMLQSVIVAHLIVEQSIIQS